MYILIYLLKSSVLLILFYLTYQFLLKRDTYHQFKRIYLLAGMTISIILPWIYYTKTIDIPKRNFSDASLITQDFTGYSSISTAGEQASNTFTLSWDVQLLLVYALIAMILLIRFVYQFFKLNQLLRQTAYKTIDSYKLHIVENKVNPFSFFKHILISQADYESENFQMIYAHEKAHINQFHSFDILLANLFCVVFWFNPVVWVYKKSIVQNLEHIADDISVKTLSNKVKYQYLLLNHTFQDNNFQSLQTTFFQSSIKQRIMMINKSTTAKIYALKSVLVLPILIFLFINFQSKIVAQEKENSIKLNAATNSVQYSEYSKNETPNLTNKHDPFDIKKYSKQPTFIDNNTFVKDDVDKMHKIIVQISKNADQKYLEGIQQTLKKKYDFDVQYKNLKFNDQGKLVSIGIDVNCNDGFSGSIAMNDVKPIHNIYFYRDYTENSRSPFGIGGESVLPDELMKNQENVSISYIYPTLDKMDHLKNTLNNKPTGQHFFINKNQKAKNTLKAKSASEFISLVDVKTYVINDKTYKLEELKRRILMVENYEFLDKETIELSGEFNDDLLYQEIEKGMQVNYKNINIIFFGQYNSPVFMNLKDVTIKRTDK